MFATFRTLATSDFLDVARGSVFDYISSEHQYRQVLSNDCFDKAAAHQQVNADVLRAIAISTAPELKARVTAEMNGSVTVGPMGINSVNFPDLRKNNVLPRDLLDQCKIVYVGAWLLKKKLIQHGNTWLAVGTYQSETPSVRDTFIKTVYASYRVLSNLRNS